jgi:N-acetylglucosaminyldiphosphoundecaprenol N-acetyl-beta-D-mannosaminyltransferase
MTLAVDNGRVRHLFGVPIQAMTMEQVLAVVDDTIARRGRLLLGVVNAAKMVNMRKNEELDRAVRSADLILADGMSIVWATRLLGRPLPERVPGIDLMTRMLERGSTAGYRVYCLGATEEVLSTAVEKMRAANPGVVMAGWHHGYFTEAEEERIAKEIRAAKADILFVAMTSPKKERFLAKWSEEMNVSVCHGVGGAFDVLAGKVKRAPQLWQRLGLEWLYRVVQEPRRMWRRYLVTNTVFCGMLVREFLGKLTAPRT